MSRFVVRWASQNKLDTTFANLEKLKKITKRNTGYFLFSLFSFGYYYYYHYYLQNGWTSLHFAAKAGYLNVVKLLVESGASTKFETKDGKLPICYAASFNHADVLSYLMHKEHGTQYLMDDKKVMHSLRAYKFKNKNELGMSCLR